MTSNSRRLSILPAIEIEDLFGLPKFTVEDQHLYFDLSPGEQELLETVRKKTSAIHLILSLGYFKAKRQFFNYDLAEVSADIKFIVELYFSEIDYDYFLMPRLSKPTRLEHQALILRLFNYQSCDADHRRELEEKAARVAVISAQPLYILRELLAYLSNQRLVTPGYTSLQDIVSRVVVAERKRIITLLQKNLSKDLEKRIDELLKADEGLYRISTLKHEPRDFTYKELQKEVERRKFFQPLHDFAKAFILMSEISNESVKYYASLVKFYTAYKLQRMNKAATQLYLLCFSYHRFRQINDNITEALMHWVSQYEEQARKAAEAASKKALDSATSNLKNAGRALYLFVDEKIPEKIGFSEVKAMAFSFLAQDSISQVVNYISNIEPDKIRFQWEYYSTLSATFKKNLRQLFIDLEFASRLNDSKLLEAIKLMQGLFRQGKALKQAKESLIPRSIIQKNLNPYLFFISEDKKKNLDLDRYEFLVYRLLNNALDSGDIFIQNSNEFRRFEDDLISDLRWEDQESILKEIGSPILLNPIKETLAEFNKIIEEKFKRINQRITDGSNKDIKVKGAKNKDKRRWTLTYPEEEESINSQLYNQVPGIGIADLLWFVGRETNFLKSFTHALDRYVKHESDPREILACIVAMGTNMGLYKMADVSGLSHSSLMTTSRNFIRLETLRSANDAISNAIAALPVFHLFDIKEALHSSSDGQRMETQINTINARYSLKYFGLKKGISSYTLVVNHVPTNSKIIGSHQYEGHYVFDILHNNTSNIKPEKHSTDTHGTNQVNFWILHAFGYRFAPRYRDLHKKMDTLVSFRHPSKYEGLLIKPARKVNEALIEKEWPNIQRIMASLAQKDTTQATIIRKLSSYHRQNQTKKALWELDSICRTIYILDFIDDVELRQSVQKALNRGEAYHRLRRAVAFVNAGKFRVKTETEQQIWNECSRLITNAIIYYNMVLLSRVYEQKLIEKDEAAIEAIKSMSPVAWQHVNLFGIIEFNQELSKVDIDAIVKNLINRGNFSGPLSEDYQGFFS